jgi:hypothetical protein
LRRAQDSGHIERFCGVVKLTDKSEILASTLPDEVRVLSDNDHLIREGWPAAT